MHIAIIGAAGMVGRKLTQRLSKEGTLGGKPVEKLTLIDIVAAETPADFAGAADIVATDISAAKTAEEIVSGRPDVIFHLAAIVSGEAELDFDKGYRINLDGTRHLFDAIRLAHVTDGYKPRVVFTSSIAVFGAPLPYPIPDEFHTTPLTSYGTQKRSANCYCRITPGAVSSTGLAFVCQRSAYGRASRIKRHRAFLQHPA